MIDGMGEMCLYILYKLVFGYVGTWLALQDNASFTHFHVLYISMNHKLLSHNYTINQLTRYMANMSSFIKRLKTSFWRLFDPNWQEGLNTLKFLLLDNMIDYSYRFETAFVLSDSQYKHLNMIVKQSHPVIWSVLRHEKDILCKFWIIHWICNNYLP